MGLFNVLRDKICCPNCGYEELREVQFRYGRVWQLTYRIGDSLEWGEGNIGKAGHEHVAVSAWINPCPACGWEGDCEVMVKSDRVTSVRPWSCLPDLVLGQDFEILSP